MLPNDGQKHSIQFYNSASVETDASELNYVVIAATDEMLDEIGGLILASGARFPSDETTSRTFRFNKSTAQELIWIGLQLMGASQLEFDGSWFDSPDSEFHVNFEQDSANKGHWFLRLESPEIIGEKGDKGDKGDTGEQGIQGIQGIPGNDGSDGSDGSDGVDGRTILSGNGLPDNSIGVDGDFYINLLNTTLYGPKVDGVWPEFGVILKGEDGENGTNGTNGVDGVDGTNGADGTDCDCVQTIPDPAHDATATLRCSVANFLGQMLKNQWDHYIDDDHSTASALTTGTASLISLGALILAPEVAIAISLFTIIGSAIASLELSNIYSLGKASFTDTVIEKVSEALFCSLGADGKITQTVKDNWGDKVLALSTSTADVYDLAATRFINAFPVEVYQILALKAPLLANPSACSGYDCESVCLLPTAGDGWIFDTATGAGTTPLFDSFGMSTDRTVPGNNYQIYQSVNSAYLNGFVKFKASRSDSGTMHYVQFDAQSDIGTGYEELTPDGDGYVSPDKAFFALYWTYNGDIDVNEFCRK